MEKPENSNKPWSYDDEQRLLEIAKPVLSKEHSKMDKREMLSYASRELKRSYQSVSNKLGVLLNKPSKRTYVPPDLKYGVDSIENTSVEEVKESVDEVNLEVINDSVLEVLQNSVRLLVNNLDPEQKKTFLNQLLQELLSD